MLHGQDLLLMLQPVHRESTQYTSQQNLMASMHWHPMLVCIFASCLLGLSQCVTPSSAADLYNHECLGSNFVPRAVGVAFSF